MSKLFRYFAILISAFSIFAQPAIAANHQNQNIGDDISYPQCGTTYPTYQAFGIVGVNNGLANTTNPCLSSELTWGNKSLGGTNQAKEQLYVNTANPGGLGTTSWPTDNKDSTGITAPNPYGPCNGSNSIACSWQYGWNRAVEDVQNRFIPGAQAAGINASPSAYTWWLDVETVNSWETDMTFNAADLEGMVSYLHTLGVTVGIYSTTAQWGQIVGSVNSSSNLVGLANWRPGAHNLQAAKSNCALAPLTGGGKVTITQYSSTTVNNDYSCI